MEILQLLIIIGLLIEVSYLIINGRKGPSLKHNARSILLDTSVLIDGRIVSIANTNFLSGTLVIPRSVIGELQFLADAADHEKRARARYGLDVVAELQAVPGVDVEILQDGSKADEGVDERLLKLAKQHGAAICTLDFNLNKVAQVENVPVLNVNELAQSLRMAHLPGERVTIELVQKGQDAHQAVGYLPDGTMVVVEHANKQMGQTVEVEVIRSLQTTAGRMMFAKQIGNQKSLQPKKQFTNDTYTSNTNKKGNRMAGRTPRVYKKPSKPVDPESSLIDLVRNS